MSNSYEIPMSFPEPEPVTEVVNTTEKEARKMKAVFNQKVLQDVEAVLQEMKDWKKAGDAYEKSITDEVKLHMLVDPSRSLVFLERSVSTSVIDVNAPQERERQKQLLKTLTLQCAQAANEVFDRAYVRAIERATRQLGDITMQTQYDRVNCVNSVQVGIQLSR